MGTLLAFLTAEIPINKVERKIRATNSNIIYNSACTLFIICVCFFDEIFPDRYSIFIILRIQRRLGLLQLPHDTPIHSQFFPFGKCCLHDLWQPSCNFFFIFRLVEHKTRLTFTHLLYNIHTYIFEKKTEEKSQLSLDSNNNFPIGTFLLQLV